MNINEFNYCLPEELIAQEPYINRELARLMVIDRKTGNISHMLFKDILEFLNPKDVLVLNDTKVIKASLEAIKLLTGAKISLLLLEEIALNVWKTLIKPAKRLKLSDLCVLKGGNISFKVLEKKEEGTVIIEFDGKESLRDELLKMGKMPIPPYIKKYPKNVDSYQTVYATNNGSVAAPTAGLHFTERLLKDIRSKGVKIAYITLHIGIGTFKPVKVDNVKEHKMHYEYYNISAESAHIINKVKKEGGSIYTVGTSTVRSLESSCNGNGLITPVSSKTDLFIYPRFKFRVTDHMITNFHLPKSTLLMLVSAFYSIDGIKKAYKEAVEKKYRFFSFGDAMLLL